MFEESDFARPIAIAVPRESSRDTYAQVKAGRYSDPGGGLIPQLHIIISDAHDIDPRFRDLLAAERLAAYESLPYGYPAGSRRADFVFYSETFNAILSANDQSTPGDPKHLLPLGRRKLRSVDYTNEYEADVFGVPIAFVAVTFTYRLERTFPWLPEVESEFQGKAVAYRDPDDGEWKLEELTLPDRASLEYIEAISPSGVNSTSRCRTREWPACDGAPSRPRLG